jgi:single-strand DNA-binding protein
MSSVNMQILVGNLGKDPEVRSTGSGKKVATFSVATSSKSRGEEVTTWHNIVAWEKLAEICEQYLKKGSKVYIQGRTSHRSYDDRDGNKKFITEVIADQMQMLSPRSEGSGGQQSRPTQQAAEPPFNPDDDIPF